MNDTVHLHPLAQVFVIPSSVSVIEGGACLEHLNRILSVETLELPSLARKDGLICNANGRILDSATICNLGSQVIILGNNGTGDETRQTIASGIPWDEELVVKDADTAISHIILAGKAPSRCLAGLGIDTGELMVEKWLEFGNSLISVNWRCANAIQILVPTSHCESLVSALVENGAVTADMNQWSRVRILSGLLDEHELNPLNLPLELGLENLVALNKGCYPGQEIHARMESRGALARSLVRLRSNDLLPEGKKKVEHIGTVTITDSCSYGGENIALAMIPNAAAEIEEFTFDDGSVASVESI